MTRTLWAGVAAYFIYWNWHEGAGALVMFSVIFGFEACALLARFAPKYFTKMIDG
jgi:hypothetical protein